MYHSKAPSGVPRDIETGSALDFNEAASYDFGFPTTDLQALLRIESDWSYTLGIIDSQSRIWILAKALVAVSQRSSSLRRAAKL